MTEQRKEGRTFADVAQQLATPGAARLTPAEEAEVEADAEEMDLTGSPLRRLADANGGEPDQDARPAWAKVPPSLVLPPGKQIGFMLFRAAWTDRPDLGDRTIVTWGLSVNDEKLARQASRGDSARAIDELAKRTIRAIDGVRADWTGKRGAGDVNAFWEQVGPKCRPLIINAYWKLHSLTAEETADFFTGCIAYRSAVAG